MQGLAAASGTRPGGAEAGGHGAPDEPNDPPEAAEGTFSQHTWEQQAPVPEAEGGPTSVGRTDLGLTSSLGLGQSGGPDIDTEDWQGG